MDPISTTTAPAQHSAVSTRPKKRTFPIPSESPDSAAEIPTQFSGRSVASGSTLGGFAAGQLLRLCRVAGLAGADADTYANVLVESLGAMAERPLDLPAPSLSFLSDDHTPVEFSLSFLPGAAPTLRVLLEPGCGAGSLAENGRIGLGVIRAMARRWGFAADKLDLVQDLFFPRDPQGLLALWCALELRSGGVPRMKVYLNPGASGAEHAAETVRAALERLGYRQAFATLPAADGYPFFALDLGDWESPRVKVYLRHSNLAVPDAGGLSRMQYGPAAETVEDFVQLAAGYDDRARSGPGACSDPRLGGLPVLTCHSFTETESSLPSGFTVHIPVRDYVRHDGEAHTRAVAALAQHGMDPAPLTQSLAALTPRRLQDGAGLIAYLALAHEKGRSPRVTAYISSEAYEVRPATPPAPQAASPVL